MAIILEWDEKQQKIWDDWVSARPAVVKELCLQFPPNKLYRLKKTGRRATIISYSEDGTMTVNVSGEYNCVIFQRDVFGIEPGDLEEAELPDPREVLGSLL